MKFFSHKIVLCVWLFCLALLLLWASRGIATLDGRFSYSPYEAIQFFAELSPEMNQRLRYFLVLDFVLFIPSYAWLCYQCIPAREKGRLFLLILLTVGTTADVLETCGEFLGTYDIGWAIGWLPQALSISTPTKWIALSLWGFASLLLFVRRRFG